VLPTAQAGTLSTTCNIGVDVALSITVNSHINFATVKAGTADTYTISTAGARFACGLRR
jgi:hypothetical protein